MNSRIIASLASRLRLLSVTAPFGVKAVPCHVRLMSAIYVPRMSRDLLLPKPVAPNLQTYRYKSKKKSKKPQGAEPDDDDDEEEEDEDEESMDKEPGVKILRLGQVRLDKILRRGLNMSRVIDEAFLEGKVWRNEVKCLKKSTNLVEGDVLDIEVGPDPKNADLNRYHRVEILEIKEGNPHSIIRLLASKNLSLKPHSR